MNTSPSKPELTLTTHAQKRMAQRGITAEMIFDTIEHGTCIRKQQIHYYIMRRKNLQNHFAPHYAEQLLNCVVVEGWTGDVLTVYKNPDAYRCIRKKTRYSTAIIDRHVKLQRQAAGLNGKKVLRSAGENPAISAEAILEKPGLLNLSRSVGNRIKTRGLTLADLLLVIEFGRKRKAKNGCMRFTLRGSGDALAMPPAKRRLLHGLSLILAPDGTVIKIKYLRKRAKCITIALPAELRNAKAAA